MTEFVKKSFDTPDNRQEFPQAKADLVRLGNWDVYRLTIEPGWNWKDHGKPMMGTETCQEEHPVWMVLSGRFAVKMEGGKQEEFGPGDTGFLPPGHDAWVVGNEPVVAIDLKPVSD